MTWTQPEDITSRWVGGDPPQNELLLTALIGDAEMLVRSEFPDIDQRIEDEEVTTQQIIFVTVSMVTRALKNPDGVRQVMEQTGPFNEQRMYDRPGTIYMNDEERDLLGGSGAGGQKAFTINTMPPTSPLHPLYGAWVNGPYGMAPGET